MPYSGKVAEIPAGFDGLNADENRRRVPPTALALAEGVIYEGNCIRKEPGANPFDPAGILNGPAIYAFADWWPTPTMQRLVCAGSDGKLYKEVGGDLDAVTIATSLSTSHRGVFAAAGSETLGRERRLVYFNGYNSPQVLTSDGTSTIALTAPAADWIGVAQPRAGVLHASRLAAFGNSNSPHRVYLSSPEDHLDFVCAKAVQLPVYPGVGQRLVAGAEYDKVLYLFKYPVGIYTLDSSPVRSQDWAAYEANPRIGIADSPHAVLSIAGRDILFLSSEGSFHLLSALATGGVEASDLTDTLRLKKWMADNLNLTRLNQVVSAWDEGRSLALFALPRAGSTVNDALLCFDFSEYLTRHVVKFSYSFRDTMQSLGMRRDTDGQEKVFFGDASGKVWHRYAPARTKYGTAYTGRYRTAATDFSFLDPILAHRKKDLDWLELEFEPKGTATLAVTIYRDGVAGETINFNANRRQDRHRLTGSCGWFALQAENSTLGQDFAVVAHRVGFTPGSEL